MPANPRWESNWEDPQRLQALMVAGLVVAASLAQIYVAVVEFPHLAITYREMLGNQPLPSFTALVLGCRWLFVGSACVSLGAAGWMTYRKATAYWLFVILGIVLLQMAIAAGGLVLPITRNHAFRPAPFRLHPRR